MDNEDVVDGKGVGVLENMLTCSDWPIKDLRWCNMNGAAIARRTMMTTMRNLFMVGLQYYLVSIYENGDATSAPENSTRTAYGLEEPEISKVLKLKQFADEYLRFQPTAHGRSKGRLCNFIT